MTATPPKDDLYARLELFRASVRQSCTSVMSPERATSFLERFKCKVATEGERLGSTAQPHCFLDHRNCFRAVAQTGQRSRSTDRLECRHL
jgi:hypothetical protein